MDSPETSSDQVRKLVDTHVDGAAVRDVRPIKYGKNDVYRVALDEGPVDALVVKAATTTPDRIRSEARAIEVVARRTDVPVPTVLADLPPDVGDTPLDVSCLLLEHIVGESYGERTDDIDRELFEQVCYEAGRHLGRLHAEFSFDGVGPVEPTDEGLVASHPYDQWADLYRQVIASQLDELEDTRFESLVPKLRSHAERAAEQVRREESFQPVLVHLDFRLANFRLQPGESSVLASVLDWGGAAAAPAAYELAHTERILLDRPGLEEGIRSSAKSEFYAGYETVRGSPTAHAREMQRRFYRLPARLRLMTHLDEVMAGRSDAETDERAREHVRAVRRYLDDVDAE